jgi:hypothetical protein
MRESMGILFFCGVVSLAGCSSSTTSQPSSANQPSPPGQTAATPAVATASPAPGETPPSPANAKPKVDACTLLTSDEIKEVQQESVKDAKSSDHATGDFLVTQCYYELPTASNSISLTLTEGSGKTGARSVKDYWEETFGKDEKTGDRDKEKKKGAEKAKPERGGEEEEESAPLEPVRGVGDEAFWSASRVGGALYVLKRDHYIRISVGGKDKIEIKLQKSKALAQKALRRL